MLKFSFKQAVILAIILIAVQSNIFAQPAFRAKERIAEFKKMKLLEVLDLDEKSSEKFLAKYNSAEKAIREKQEKLDEAILDLEYLIRKKSNQRRFNKAIPKSYGLTARFDEHNVRAAKGNKIGIDRRAVCSLSGIRKSFPRTTTKSNY